MVNVNKKSHRKTSRRAQNQAIHSDRGSLFNRIGSKSSRSNDTSNAEDTKKATGKSEGSSNALKVINGRLINADDIGAQLREFNKRNISKNKAHKRALLAGNGSPRRRKLLKERIPAPMIASRSVFSSSNYDDESDMPSRSRGKKGSVSRNRNLQSLTI
ncbi:uncharacterized protein Ecym_6376 [Eremothecium cymbalariae DBVPG|uniref:Uncharacterized protein n=1 Tax=Eremothecium cymbalariae (strain CBS 270.75 / DBVPG 7215 / KCTC 17166 / NRRL Y-17582) TaxID=931890 RepID=G8JUH1_ERECY|nr:hypothetical protein Ecym_6376 [Eremothecium cymbalariae DBVPG\